MTKLRLVLGVLALAAPVAAWVGCGSNADDSLLGPAADDAGSDATTDTSTSPVVDSGSPADDAGDAGDAGDARDAGDSGNLPDGSVAADGGDTPDAGPGGTLTTLPCGTATCAIPGQSCCVEMGGGGATTYLCVVGPSANCPNLGGGDVIGLKCSSAANCSAGQQCCASTAGGTVTLSACVPQGTCTGAEHAVLCNKNAVTTGCDAGVTCTSNNVDSWALPNNFATCGGVQGPF